MDYLAFDFWKRVNNLIKAQNSKQQTVAESCGIPYQTFRGWVTHQTYPNALLTVRIARHLNTSVEYLITGSEPQYQIPDDLMAVMRKYVLRKSLDNPVKDYLK